METERRGRCGAPLLVWIAVASFAWAGLANAHEPIFGIGPHTIHQYGIGFEVEREGDDAIGFEAIYGVTEDLAVTASMPRRRGAVSGWGAPMLRAKWRFYRNDGPGGSNQAAVAFGVRLPGIDVGPEAPGYLLAATVGREARREYVFAGLRYLWNATDSQGRRPSHWVKYDVAVGLRPFPAGYKDPDLVVLVELNGTRFEDRPSGASPRGNRIGVGPGVLLTYRNVMFKAGVDVILIEDSERVPFGDEIEGIVALEVHLSPFSFVYGD